MTLDAAVLDRPAYDYGDRAMLKERAPLAPGFAKLILDTTRPFTSTRREDLCVLDVGCGYGYTALELAKHCRSMTGIEPTNKLATYAKNLALESGLSNFDIREQSVYQLDETSVYDLVVLDNVLEHLSDQPMALRKISQCLKPGGVAFILVPNKLWPIEVHYRLPFLSYLPLRAANWYLRVSGRGHDYADASHEPTYWRLKRLLRAQGDLTHRFELPSDLSLATQGKSFRYALGAAAIRRYPWLWAISKVFLVIAVKT